MEAPSLLHNMSVPPGTAIAHKAPPPRCRAIAFRLSLSEAELEPAQLLARLDQSQWGGTPEDAERELRRRLNEHAAGFPYPAAVLVSNRLTDADHSPKDVLTVCTVLAKSSGQVYLRDKEPNLANLRPGRVVVLHIPKEESSQC